MKICSNCCVTHIPASWMWCDICEAEYQRTKEDPKPAEMAEKIERLEAENKLFREFLVKLAAYHGIFLESINKEKDGS